MEEFLESEVLWPDHDQHQHKGDTTLSSSSFRSKKKKNKDKNLSHSRPVRIPENMRGRAWSEDVSSEEFDNENDDEMVPPHIMLSSRRRFQQKMAYSVCTGNGRTLKGRDLSQVRNSILRMTGFLETC